MQEIKLAVFLASSHLSKLIVTLAILKLIALSVGPAGMGFLGNYMSLVSIATALAGGGVITALVKYLSEFDGDKDRQKAFVGSAIIYCSSFSLLTFFVGWIFENRFSYFIFGEEKYEKYILLFFFSQIIAGFINLSYGYLNGLRESGKYALVVLMGNSLSLIAAYFSIEKYGMFGAVLALTFPMVFPLMPAYYLILKKKNWVNFSPKVIWLDCKNLSKFTLMLIVSAVCFPVVEIFVRKNIDALMGVEAVGIWQALIRLSSAYLSFFSVFLSFYLVPKISAENNKEKIKKYVFGTMIFISFLFVLVALFMFFLKNEIIAFVFSTSFLEAGNYIFVQMLGDYFRLMGWVIGFVIVAKAATKLYITAELFQGLLFIALVEIALHNIQTLNAVVYAYTLTCFLYFIVSCFGFSIFLKK